ncbi:MAG: 2-phospho-L-lactate transferase CofD family protein, partial [Gloeomargarita sp. DG_1_4_bins_134]
MGKSAPPRLRQWLKWLKPGLLVKRWLLVTFMGTVLVVLGLSIFLRLTPVNSFLQLIESILRGLATVIPSYISGPVAILTGIGLIIWSQTRSVGSLSEALRPEGEQALVDVLIAQRQRNRGPKIVALGGGTGLSRLLRGLKAYSSNITAIVTVADDGGSSGRLRREVGVLPPGDIRNCLAALASEEQL